MREKKSLWEAYVREHERFLTSIWAYRQKIGKFEKVFTPNINPWFMRMEPSTLPKLAKFYELLLENLKEDFGTKFRNLRPFTENLFEIMESLRKNFSMLADRDLTKENQINEFLYLFEKQIKIFIGFSMEFTALLTAIYYEKLTKRELLGKIEEIQDLNKKSLRLLKEGTKIARKIEITM